MYLTLTRGKELRSKRELLNAKGVCVSRCTTMRADGRGRLFERLFCVRDTKPSSVPKGNVRCAAVRSWGSNTSPFAVWRLS
jgi:hypothetical protein